ncbi:hypothetical protein [Streptomyces fragilis]|nr:hypothetical protein [Streptomyces fragilis]
MNTPPTDAGDPPPEDPSGGESASPTPATSRSCLLYTSRCV